MKILHCCEWYEPLQCGVSKVNKIYSKYAAEKGYDSYVATTLIQNTEKYEEIDNVKIYRFNIRGNDVKTIKGNKKEFISFLEREKFDVIITYAAQTWHFDILKRIKKEKIGSPILIAFPCGFSGLLGYRKLIYKQYFKLLPKYLSNFDLVILHSNKYHDYEYILKHYQGKIKILPNGVDIKEFDINIEENDILKKYNIDSTKKIILNVSNHMYAKNHRDFRKLAKAFPEYNFIQVGRDNKTLGSCYKNCAKYSNKIDNFYSLQLNRNEIIDLYKKAWLFILTSRVEVFPLVLIESIVSETPFISYDVGNAKQLQGGYIVDTFKELKNTLNLVSTDIEYNKLKKLISIEKKNEFDWSSIMNMYYDEINILIEEKSKNKEEKIHA